MKNKLLICGIFVAMFAFGCANEKDSSKFDLMSNTLESEEINEVISDENSSIVENNSSVSENSSSINEENSSVSESISNMPSEENSSGLGVNDGILSDGNYGPLV